MKKFYIIFLNTFSLIIISCQASPTPLDPASIQNTAVAIAWTSISETQIAFTPQIPPASTTVPTKSSSSFSLEGDFEVSWNIYSSEYNSLGGIYTIRKQGSAYTGKLVMSDGSSGTYDLTLISEEEDKIKLTESPGNAFGDYMLITKDGYLHFYDSLGLIYSVPPLR